MGEAVPGQLFADLRQQVVREQPHCAQQPVQDVAEEGLRDTNKRPTLVIPSVSPRQAPDINSDSALCPPRQTFDCWPYLQRDEHRADVDGEVEDGDDHADDEVGLQTLVLLAHVQNEVRDGEVQQRCEVQQACLHVISGADSPQRP